MDKDLKISICIPTWEQYGLGVNFLKELLTSITRQSYKNFNVIISDHSLNDEIKNLSNEFSNTLEINYFNFNENRGNGPSNTNNGLKNCDGDIIKIMFQDDLFFDDNSLYLINHVFNDDRCNWIVNGCNHSKDGKNFYGNMIPYWNEKILYGVNTISSPSVLSFRNKKINNCLFDENLIMLMDCEYYYQLYLKYGLPKIIPNILISNRVHDKQISSLYNKDINEEIRYIKNKYNLNENRNFYFCT